MVSIEGRAQIKLPNYLTIPNADSVVEQIGKNIDTDQLLLVDFSETETIDLTGVQLICSLFLSLEKNKVDYSISEISESLIQQVECYGFSLRKLIPKMENKND